jgi:hypothetical protein
MMAIFDIMCFLEYYANRANVVSGGKRTPTRRFQNFFQLGQPLAIDSDIVGTYPFLTFDVDGFGSDEAGSINDFRVTMPALGDIVDLTESAFDVDNLVIASLVIQPTGQTGIDPINAEIISRYIGSIEAASMTDESVSWVVNPAIDKIKSQMPSKKISSDLIGRFVSV